MTFKEKIYQHFQQLIDERISLLRHTLNELKESSANETKSSAGDKHETALAMLQIEQENTGRQLREALEQKLLFEKIDITIKTNQIIPGSLVKTSRGWLFLSVALEKIVVDDIKVAALSPASPLGKKMMGLHIKDTAEINGICYVLEDVV